MSSLTPLFAAAAADAPAGGAAIDQVAIATVSASILTAALLWIGLRYRAGGVAWLRSLGVFAARHSGLPAWAAVSAQLAGASLLVAFLGMYWDISLHIDVGRDEGPLANPAHYLILIGLYGLLASGFLAVVMADEDKPSPAAIKLNDHWHAPLGGVLMIACGGYALLGFPLDDVWHRLFGQDVTLWGPTHLMLIGGAVMGLVGLLVIVSEGRRAVEEDHAAPTSVIAYLAHHIRTVGLMGGFLVGLATFQAEFDWGVPQFNMLFEPALIAVSGAIGLVCARMYLGRGAAVAAAIVYLLLRGGVSLIVGPVFGQTTPHFALYLPSAILVELVFLIGPKLARERPYVMGALAGLVVGTVGSLAESAWSHVWMPMPWPSSMLPEALVVGAIAGLAGGVIGAFMGQCLRPEVDLPRLRPGRILAPAALGAVIVLYGVLLSTGAQSGVTGTVTLRDVDSGPNRTVEATLRVTPASATDDVRWITATAWQGGGFHVDHLDRVAPGVYRTTEPLPVHDDWKAMFRLHQGSSIMAMPIHLPEDRAIPAPEVPAPASFSRPFVEDKLVLQREAKTDVPGWLWTAAGLVVLFITLTLLGALGWGLLRLAETGEPLDPDGAVAAASAKPAVGPTRAATA
ncbi:MAG: hypothetical protein JHC95_15790 [Solirubrobacteraceae bacterium]|nr:hypothetical protein [Solirubrobacteraceae bacterium]